jgi:hypothetical protein
MKTFKLIDITGQLILTIIALYLRDFTGFMVFYFGVGGWQVISCLVHVLAMPRSERNASRRAYEWTLIVVLLIGVLIAYVMIFIGAIMALWYCITCIAEMAENKTTTIETI